MDDKIEKNLEKVRHILVVMSGKGGVGKSTVAANLSVALAEKGKMVGILDADFHGPNIPKMLGVEAYSLGAATEGRIEPVRAGKRLKVVSLALLPNLGDSPVIWRGPLKINVIRQLLSEVVWDELDYLIVDLPPGTGDEPLTIAQMAPREKSKVVIVTTPQEVALLDVRRAIQFASHLSMPVVGIIENMSVFICPHCGKETHLFSSGGGEKVAEETGILFLGKVPFDPEVVSSGDLGRPFVVENPNGQTAKSFNRIIQNILNSLNNLKEV